MTAASGTDLANEVASRTWYHTIELPGGVVTPGEYDTRSALACIPFPARLDGKRCLDVGTHDGFWAFTMERRGAAEVVAIDLDDPREIDYSEPVPALSEAMVADRESRPSAFALAHNAFDSRVDRRNLSVYALSRDVVGEFDFAYLGTLLLHLRDPIAALTAVRHVMRPGGRMLINDAVSLDLTLLHPRRPVYSVTLFPGRPFWWSPNVAGLRRFMEKAGFAIVDSGGPYWVRRGAGYARPREERLWDRLVLRRGMPHGWVIGEAT
jgi:tRNA (mo5U34)-methyltransferase